MNQQLFKKNFFNQSSRTISVTNGSHHVPTTKSTLFVVNKDEWDTKEGRGKSTKNALHVQRYGKGTSWAEAMSNNEKINPIALAIVQLRESEGIRQAGSS